MGDNYKGERVQQHPQTLDLCAAALNTGTFSQAGKRDRDTVISSKNQSQL